MKKTDKKTDKQLRQCLTNVCEDHFESIHGFVWLSHEVNFNSINVSLRVICVFDSNENQAMFESSSAKEMAVEYVQKSLQSININLKNATKQIRFDSEERCKLEHNGSWANRIAQKYR